MKNICNLGCSVSRTLCKQGTRSGHQIQAELHAQCTVCPILLKLNIYLTDG